MLEERWSHSSLLNPWCSASTVLGWRNVHAGWSSTMMFCLEMQWLEPPVREIKFKYKVICSNVEREVSNVKCHKLKLIEVFKVRGRKKTCVFSLWQLILSWMLCSSELFLLVSNVLCFSGIEYGLCTCPLKIISSYLCVVLLWPKAETKGFICWWLYSTVRWYRLILITGP